MGGQQGVCLPAINERKEKREVIGNGNGGDHAETHSRSSATGRVEGTSGRSNPGFDVEQPPFGTGTAILVLTLFVLSGATGLVYETIWTRMLTLVFGNTVHAASTVVAAFMGGLAIGSFYFGRLADRRKDVLRIYGLLECGVAIFALCMPFILDGLNIVYGHLFRAFGEQPAPFFVARFILSFILLLPPTILMGATLPVLTRFFVRQRGRLGKQVAGLYALNTLGATAGCFLAGFFLVEKLGVTASNYATAATSLVIAACILLLARRIGSERGGSVHSEREEPTESRSAADSVPATGGYSPPLRRLILVCIALVGFTSLGYEVLWMRVIIYVVTATTEAFAIVLTTFLAGIALGSLLVARWVDRWRRLLTLFGLIEIAIGFAVIASIPLLGNLYELSGMVSRLVQVDFWGLTAMKFMTTVIVIIIPTLLMGAAFPVATNGFIRSVGGVGRGVGSLYALNTVGAVCGSLAAGFLILPAMGAQMGLMFFALLNLIVGVVLWAAEPGRRIAGTVGCAAVAATGFIIGLVFIPEHTFHRLFNHARSQTEMIYCSEGVTATVTVHRFPPGTNFQDNLRVICTTGEDVAGSDYMLRTTQMLQGHLPLLMMKPGPRAMQVGFGSGETVRVLLLEGASKLDVAEICPGLVRAAPLFADINKRAWEDPRVRIIFMDAKNYALLTGETYDIILNDSIHPRVSGNASLYTVDYFEDCRKHIAPGGLMSSWFPVYGMRPEELRMIIKSFQTVFPHATLWMAHNVVNRHAQLLAPVDDVPLRIDYRDFRERILAPHIQEDLAVVDLNDPDFFISSLVMDEHALREFTEGAEVNSDEHPLLEYGVPKFIANDELAWADILESMIPTRSDVRNLLVNLPEDPEEREALDARLGSYYESNKYVARAMVKGLRGDPTSRQEFDRAYEICPEHPAVRIARERRDSQLSRLKQMAQEKPSDPEALSRLGHAYWRSDRLEEAAATMERAARFDPENAQISRWLGDIRRAGGEYEKGAAAYRRTLELRPGNLSATIGLAFALEGTGDVDGAAEAYRRALEIEPSSVEALNSLALLELGRGSIGEAITLYRRMTEITPDSPDGWNNLAWLLAEEGTDLGEARRYAERAVELAPSSASAHDTFSWVLYKLGELTAAREAAVRALEIDPDKEASRQRIQMIDQSTAD